MLIVLLSKGNLETEILSTLPAQGGTYSVPNTWQLLIAAGITRYCKLDLGN